MRKSTVATTLVGFVAFLSCLLAIPLLAAEQKPLTNDDVAKLVTASVGDDIVVRAIAQAPREELDVSSDALTALKKAGASAAVVDAMVKRVADRKPPMSATAATPASPPAAVAKPGEVTLFLTEKPKGEYKELGRVDAKKYNFAGIPRTRAALDEQLKKKAAALGADAVINITEDFASVSGVAVKLAAPAPQPRPSAPATNTTPPKQ